MSTKDTSTYRPIPILDNLHILFWLIKDACWALMFRPGGIVMIVPTMSVAVYMLWKSRHYRSEVFHNIAVCLWIAANSLWMCGEFFQKELRPIAVVLFAIGLAVLAVYYIFYFRTDRQQARNHRDLIR